TAGAVLIGGARRAGFGLGFGFGLVALHAGGLGLAGLEGGERRYAVVARGRASLGAGAEQAQAGDGDEDKAIERTTKHERASTPERSARDDHRGSAGVRPAVRISAR